ncbi:hypothetical protein [Pedobacter frigiditerrae]|uniref:hypothetical protein n=1 Tax=Pedobacter frigiditerrae TaxID=2530452 RepID=UPI00292F4AFE|nr:hypothetical protein [Pedobacter frigiditerrae]
MDKLSQKLIQFRTLVRANNRDVINHLVRNYLQRDQNGRAIRDVEPPFCIICSRSGDISKEHILPRWVYEKDEKAFFNIGANGQPQSYNKATVPMCTRCNSEILNELEKYLQSTFQSFYGDETSLDFDALVNIVRWLELIDYKFQVMNLVKRFVSPKGGKHIPFLKDYPIYMLLPNRDWSPAKVVSEIRWTLNRLSIKSKENNINSLVVFRTKNKANHFFHNLNEFIFIEIVRYKIAVFYFYDRVFDSEEEAKVEATNVLDRVYK